MQTLRGIEHYLSSLLGLLGTSLTPQLLLCQPDRSQMTETGFTSYHPKVLPFSILQQVDFMSRGHTK